MPRCLLISNRLPLSFDDKTKRFIPSSGGLVSAIKGIDARKVGYDIEWMGILTDDVELEQRSQLKSHSHCDLPCHEIIVPKDIYNQYYNDFCNNVIWPLFHYERSQAQHSDAGWESYQKINEMVALEIMNVAKDDDTVWIHDFHFFLVPGLIKSKRPELKVGFFLHIPFPSSEIFRELPQRKEILQSLVQCDLLGFHDLSYLTHFKSSVSRVLGGNTDIFNERIWGVYPISIDSDHFLKLAATQETQNFIQRYAETKRDKKWILGVDRLDYIKGLVLKLKSFEEFLRRNPELRETVQMVQIVIPSRTQVPEYQKLKHKVEQLVSSINGEFGTPSHMPIHYLFHSVTEHELSALYQLSDVMHIGSRRDGMNLVCLEYVVSQNEKHPGVLLLSEFAGAHSTMSYAISINPWDIEETANKMKEALDQPLLQRQREMMTMKDFLKNYTSSEWARCFMQDLHREATPLQKTFSLNREGFFPWMKEIKGKKILIFCDLDGTLAPLSPYPSQVRLHEETKELLKRIAQTNNLQLVIVSGRDQEFLHNQFIDNNFNFPLAACHGAYAYTPETQEWTNLIPHDSKKWKENIIDIFKLYTSRTPGSFLEDKGHAVTWHYRNSPPDFADFLSNKLFIELEEGLTSLPAQVTRGKKSSK